MGLGPSRTDRAPQCCDASTYLEEARLLAAQGWTSDWLLPWHNYGYPLFLLAIDAIGLGGRLGLGVVQLALLYLAAGALAYALARCMRASSGPVMATVSAIALLPAAAWSGYSLTEGLVAPLLMVMLALGIVVCRRVLSGGSESAVLTVAATGLVSGLAWMVWPALVWVPAAMGLLIGKSEGLPVARRPPIDAAAAAMRQSAWESVTPRAPYVRRQSPAS